MFHTEAIVEYRGRTFDARRATRRRDRRAACRGGGSTTADSRLNARWTASSRIRFLRVTLRHGR